MQINHIRISSILGIDELSFDAGKFNEISGQNGQGKTSVLESIKAALQSGHDATLLRNGAEQGEIVLVLDDGTQISKRVTEKSSPVTVVQDGKKVQRPSDVLKTLTDLLSVNPIDFLRAPKKDRVRVLLEAMPLEVDAQKLTKISGVPVQAGPGVHALAVINLVRQQVYDDRTGTNRAIKEKDATINQLKQAMPDAPEGVEGSEDELQGQVEAARTAKDAELARVQTKLTGLQTEAQVKIDAIREKAQQEIDAINAELTDWTSKANLQREKTNQQFVEKTTPINQAIAAIKTNRSSIAKRMQAIETVRKMETELGDLQKDEARQTKALTDIDAYKIELLAALPIPGLEVIDGELFRDGVQFDRLNTAQQVDIAVEIAKLRAGDLKICCVDGVELLDSAAFDAFRERAIESDLQLFVSRVSDAEFSVKTDTQ